MKAPQEAKNRATIRSSNPTLGHISREKHGSKGYMHPSVHCSAVHNSQDMEATQMSINRRTDKEDEVHISMEYHSATKKNETMPSAATWMKPETIILSEVRQRKTNITYDSYAESA